MAKAREYVGLIVAGAACYGLFSLFSGCNSSQTPQEHTAADLSAHPGYEADMNALTAHLADNGVQASWPGGYGDSKQPDTIYLSLAPSDRKSAAPELAQRVYAKMSAVRQKDGYGDQAAACFVHVLDAASSSELAVDRMGRMDQ